MGQGEPRHRLRRLAHLVEAVGGYEILLAAVGEDEAALLSRLCFCRLVGADPTIQDNVEQTASDWAHRYHHSESCAILDAAMIESLRLRLLRQKIHR